MIYLAIILQVFVDVLMMAIIVAGIVACMLGPALFEIINNITKL